MAGKILISACLAGLPVRYNGSAKPLVHAAVDRWMAEGRLVTLCPELAGGFQVPRPPAEIENGLNGDDVLDGGRGCWKFPAGTCPPPISTARVSRSTLRGETIAAMRF